MFSIFQVTWQVCASGSTRCSKPAWIRPAWREPGFACRIRSKLHLSFLWDRYCSRLCCRYRCFHIFFQTSNSRTFWIDSKNRSSLQKTSQQISL